MRAARGLSLRPEDMARGGEGSGLTICVVGLGRMGLPTACLYAEAGFEVIGADINPAVVRAVSSGEAPFEEPGLEELLSKNVEAGRLRATTDVREASSKADVVKVIVPTPIDEHKRPDYSSIRKACREVGLGLRPGSLIIIESTVGPGTTEEILKKELEEASGLRAGEDFGLAYSPIRATSGRVLKDLARYPRVLGAVDEDSLRAAKAILLAVTEGGVIEVSSIKTAEAVKLFENVYRDVVLALTNELAHFCEEAGIDFLEVAEAANSQPYCHLLKPGLVGGHIPKDPYLLFAKAEELGVRLRVAKAARAANDDVVRRVLKMAREALREHGKSLRRARIAILGISYKANVKNPAGSKALELVKRLRRRCKSVSVWDPFYTKSEAEALGYPAASSLTEALSDADCVIITVGHTKFKELDLRALKGLVADPCIIVDAAGAVEPGRARMLGLIYRGLGRAKG